MSEALLLSLAPLAGFTDRAFRTLCKRQGADLMYSEMVSAKAVVYGDRNSEKLAAFGEAERPFYIQLFGSEPEVFSEAVRILERKLSPDGFDINAGCPVPKVVKSGEGNALMKDPGRIGEIVRAMKDSTALPVTVKLRTGFDEAHRNVLDCALAAQAAGAAGVTVHGRTREGGFSAPIDYESIAAVRKALSIPVCANGGIDSPANALVMIEKTGVSRLMIARGALGKPWIFADIRAALAGETPPAHDAGATVQEHIRLACADKPLSRALPQLRGQLVYYLKGKRGAAQAREELMRACSREQIVSLFKRFFEERV